MTDLSLIRNFSIIAHIDHGKSTLADRLLMRCGAVSEREFHDQMLDSMDIERERGITIKAQTVRLDYPAQDGKTYVLNLMDTPGHVDFAYEVSRSLAACEGSLLVVDASQGVEAQTLANAYHAIEANHEIIPVLNKIDLPSADPDRVCKEIEDVIGIDTSDAVRVSAKTGVGIDDLLEAMVKRLPPPKGDRNAPLKALLVDSWYDPYLGVVTLVRVQDGVLKKGLRIRMMAVGAAYDLDKVGIFAPKPTDVAELGPGEIGFIIAGIKTIADCKVGDTITDDRKPAAAMLAGFKPSVPVVFCGLFPADAAEFETLRESLGKLRLNDASFHFEPETSAALGFGFRCGFLGLLHLESMQEPWIKATIITPDEHLGSVLTLCQERRGQQVELTYAGTRAMAIYRLPLNEVVFDFYDRLKSVTRGYASFDYERADYQESDPVKLSILVNSAPVDALSMIVHKAAAESRGRALCERLKDLIPRQLFKIAIQAAIGGRVIARETISALRKDVLAKCYGGDISRKKKLLEKQKKGKKRMRQIGDVEIPQSAFIAALKMDSR